MTSSGRYPWDANDPYPDNDKEDEPMKLHKSLTPDVIEEAVQRRLTSLDNPGFCTDCGHEHEGVEPDAANYECEACGEPMVFGAEELLMRIAARAI